MFFIPGFLISIITFPGVIVHEIAHRLFADWAKVKVYKVCYFRVGNPAGYVIHGPVNGLSSSLLISIGPLIVNSILCSLICFSAVFPMLILSSSKIHFVFYVLMWVGISIGMHAFPSNQDMNNFVETVARTKNGGPMLWAAKAFSLLLRLANTLRFFWFDAVYSIGLALALPFGLGYL